MAHCRILTSPVRLTGSIHPEQLSAFVAIDAMLKRRELSSSLSVSWPLTTVVGDAAVQRAVQRVVAREGDDRDHLGRDGFAARARQLESEAADDLRRLLDTLELRADVETCDPSSDTMTRIARVAFVRLYDAGVLSRTEAILDSCPSCETVVDDADADEVDIDAAVVRVSIELIEGALELDTTEPELWVGAVAVAVPAETAPADEVVLLPLLEADVPLIAVEGIETPVVVVPGHDRWSHDLARQLNLPVVQVLDGEGVVRQPSAFAGLGRFAARAAAIESLSASGHIVAHFEMSQRVKRCYRCATVLVPLFGRHWILDMGVLVEPVSTAIESGEITFDPPSLREEVLAMARRPGAWCVSQQLWSGQRIPVATCLDCGQTRVSVETDSSCGSCMGTLEAHTDVIDARFVAALSPLAIMGWPLDTEEPGQVETTLSTRRVGLETWGLPMAALTLRLAGSLPFSHVVLHQTPVGVVEPGQRPIVEMIDLVNNVGRRAVRAGLLAGDLDIDRAAGTLTLLDDPRSGEANIAQLVEKYDKLLDVLDAGGALALLVGTANNGVSDDIRNLFPQLCAPLLGNLTDDLPENPR